MNVVLDIDDFELENVYFQDPVKNTVMDNSDFIRTSIFNKTIYTQWHLSSDQYQHVIYREILQQIQVWIRQGTEQSRD